MMKITLSYLKGSHIKIWVIFDFWVAILYKNQLRLFLQEYETLDPNDYSHILDLIRRIVTNFPRKFRSGVLLGI